MHGKTRRRKKIPDYLKKDKKQGVLQEINKFPLYRLIERKQEVVRLVLWLVVFFLQSLFISGAFFEEKVGLLAQTRPPQLQLLFSGNQHLSGSTLRKLWPAGESAPDSAQVNTYLKQIMTLYHKKGFYFAGVDSFRLEKLEMETRLTIWIRENNPLRIRGLNFSGNRVFSERDLLNRFRMRRGSVFHEDIFRKDVQNLLNRYAEKGFPLTKIEVTRFRVDSTLGGLWLTLSIREGPPGRLDSIVVQGNKVTRRETILREIGLRPGARYSSRKLEEIGTRLRRLPFLHLAGKVDVRWDSAGSGMVVIPVREENMAHFDGTVGYNPPRGRAHGNFTGLIDVSFQNLFGTGRAFSAFWQKKEAQSQEIRLFYKEPWILNHPISATLNFEQRLQDSTYIRRAWSTGIDFRWWENFQLLAQVGRESVLPDSLGSILLGIQKSRALRFSAGVQFDNRDDWLNPQAGMFYRTTVDFLNRRTEGKTQAVRRMSLDFEGYWNWFGRQVWALQLHGRQVRFPGSVVPVEEQFFLGGSRTLRGYREDQFRGSRTAWSNLEYRYLLGPKSRVFLFLDSGWISSQKNAGQGWVSLFKLGYGFGVRLQTALGVVGLDYGLGERDAPTQGKIHLRLINQF